MVRKRERTRICSYKALKRCELHTVETDTDLVSEEECDITSGPLQWSDASKGKDLCGVDSWHSLLQ